MAKERIRLQSMKELEKWLENSQAHQQAFLAHLDKSQREKLDMSIESMEWLGEWLCNRYPNLEEADNNVGIRLLDGVGRYVSETFIKYFGGDWTVELNNPHYLYSGDPGITNYNHDGYMPETIYPQFWVTATIIRPEPEFIIQRFKHHLEHVSKYRRTIP
jgi:hypothetical protein